MIRGGYKGKVLRVDLTNGLVTTEGLPSESVLRKYVGCRGLGVWYLMKELDLGVGALEPGNPIILFNGPIIGTKVSSSTNTTLTTLNGETGYTVGRAHTHGWFGIFLNRAGYDGMIITGASDKWVYLWINDEKVELRDAKKFLGKDTHETEDLIKEDLGLPTKTGAKDGASVAAIGPSGENLCTQAGILNDRNHGFYHSGVGAIMGSKRLKAIAVRGTGNLTSLFDKEKFNSNAKEWNKAAMTRGFAPVVAKAGVPRQNFDGVRALLGIAGKNFLANELPGFGERMSEQKLTPKPCYGCIIGCCYDAEPLEGPYKGQVFTLSGGGENSEGAASIVGVTGDPGTIWYLTDLCDRLGFEASSIGCSMAVAFEAYEKGVLTIKDTDGLELKWGDAKVVETLMKRVASKEGKFATALADGPLVAAQRVGLPDAAVHCKGSGINLHDWRRGGWGVLLGQLVGNGAGWFATGIDCWGTEPDCGYPEKSDPYTSIRKGEEVARTGAIKAWHDSYGVCWFIAVCLEGVLEFSSTAIAAAVGWEDFRPDEGLEVGYRILALERIFEIMHGLRPEDDFNASPRLAGPAPADAGPAAGVNIRPYLEGMTRDYYENLGWDRTTSKPLKSTMERLGMEEFIDLIYS